jgi:multidrug transporter EmrE-like cation transporter
MQRLLILCAAALLYVVGGLAMKSSRSLTVLLPTLAIYIAFAGGATLQTIGMTGARMGTTYVVVVGLEAILAIACAAVILKETVSVPQLCGAALVVLGVAILELSD